MKDNNQDDNQKKIEKTEKIQPDYVRAECTIESIGYFEASYKRRFPQPRQSRNITYSAGRTIKIIASAKYGYPNAEDMDFYRGFLKICDECVEFVTQNTSHPLLPQSIRFSTNELMRKSGYVKTGHNWQAVRDWIKRMRATGIEGLVYNAREKGFSFKELGSSIFLEVMLCGDKMADGSVSTVNQVSLSPWFIENYYHHYTKPVDISFHQVLDTAIAKCLYPLLDLGWYAANDGPFKKKYKDLAVHLGIKIHPYLSLIKQQFDQAHAELQKLEYLAKWEYELNSSGEVIITWWPGPKYFKDQGAKKERYERVKKILGETPQRGMELGQLINDITAWSEDAKSSVYFTQALEDVGIDMAYMIFSEARQADLEGRIRTTRARYLIDFFERHRGRKPLGNSKKPDGKEP